MITCYHLNYLLTIFKGTWFQTFVFWKDSLKISQRPFSRFHWTLIVLLIESVSWFSPHYNLGISSLIFFTNQMYATNNFCNPMFFSTPQNPTTIADIKHAIKSSKIKSHQAAIAFLQNSLSMLENNLLILTFLSANARWME